ncbi:MAG: hypothetical protein HN948_08255 [Clostridia bacterium]|jgi:4-oxalomesaconate hydratase|nr:hypothetical protein [Clostridia bacterium]MBT7122985.1 hypothetical protein [Clostridia bacterium]
MKKLKILMICAHPGDAFDDSGGTLCHHAMRGDEVTVCLMTSGTRSHAALFTDEKRKSKGERNEAFAGMDGAAITGYKEREIIAAGKELGITDVRFFEEEDDLLLINEVAIKKVADLIRELKPDILITHHPMQDGGLLTTHPIVGQIVLLGNEAAGARWTRDEKVPPHQVKQVFFVGALNGKPWSLSQSFIAQWRVYVDITDVVDRKVKALDCLASQRYDGDYARKRAEACDGYWGTRMDIPYGETFIPMLPEVHEFLPIMDSTLETNTGWTARIGRLSEFKAHMVPYKKREFFE